MPQEGLSRFGGDPPGAPFVSPTRELHGLHELLQPFAGHRTGERLVSQALTPTARERAARRRLARTVAAAGPRGCADDRGSACRRGPVRGCLRRCGWV